MKKSIIRRIADLIVLLLLYILFVFLIPFVHTAAFWVSLAFSLAAFAVTTASRYIAVIQKPDAKSKFYGFPIARIGLIYGAVQVVLSLLFMALSLWVPVWVVVLVCAIALGAAVIGLISADTVVGEIQVQDEKLKKNISLMRGLQSKLNQMASQCDNPDAAAAVKKFAEEMRYSDPVSSDELAEAERDLSAVIDELQAAVVDGDSTAVKQLCSRASNLLAERNRLCKLNKG